MCILNVHRSLNTRPGSPLRASPTLEPRSSSPTPVAHGHAIHRLPEPVHLDRELHPGDRDDVLRDVYLRGKYRDVIGPMTVIRRLDAVLELAKAEAAT